MNCESDEYKTEIDRLITLYNSPASNYFRKSPPKKMEQIISNHPDKRMIYEDFYYEREFVLMTLRKQYESNKDVFASPKLK